jgi:hypothetical protein
LCEAFLEIPPHFKLFRTLFRLKPHPTKERKRIPISLGLDWTN